jgi:hypothetical protein
LKSQLFSILLFEPQDEEPFFQDILKNTKILVVFEPGLSPACSANPPFRHFFVRADSGPASKRGQKSSKTRKLFLTPLPTVGDI